MSPAVTGDPVLANVNNPLAVTLVVAASDSLYTGRADYQCDGTNDEVEIQAAIDAISAAGIYGTVRLLGGNYNVAVAINPASGVVLDLGDAVINWSGAAEMIKPTGSLGSSTALTAQGSKGDTVLDVTDASIFTAGDYVLIRSENTINGFKDGEIHRIRSVNVGGNQITIEEALWLDYLLADTATAQVVNAIVDVVIRGGFIVGTAVDSGQTALRADYNARMLIDNVSVQNCGSVGFQLVSCVDSEIKGSRTYGTANGAAGQGISVICACSNINIHDNEVCYGVHGISAGASPTVYGTPKFVNVHHNTISSISSIGLDCHSCNAYYFTYKGNIVSGGAYGISCGAVRWTAEDNIFNCTGEALQDRDNLVEEVVLRNNFVERCEDDIAVFDSAALVSLVIDGLYYSGESMPAGKYFIYIGGNASLEITLDHLFCVSSGNTGNPLVRLVTGAARFCLYNSVLKNADRQGVQLTTVTSGEIIGNEIADNGDGANEEGLELTSCSGMVIANNRVHGNHGHGIGLYTCSNMTIIGNSLTENSQGGNNTWDDIFLDASDYCNIQGNTCRAGAQANKPRYGVNVSNSTSDGNYIVDNDLYDDGFATSVFNDAGTGTKLNTFVVPFVDGSDPQDSGYLIDANTEYARSYLRLPAKVHQVVRMKVYARSVVLEADAMRCEFVVKGGADNEAYDTHDGSVADHPSTSSNFAADDIIYWTMTTAGVLALLGGDSVEVKVLHEAAGGDDCATNAYFRTVEIEYV